MARYRPATAVLMLYICCAFLAALGYKGGILRYASQQTKSTTAAHTMHTATSCPAWLDGYEKFHSANRGRVGTKYLVHLSQGNGGLGDRLHGALSMLRLAKALNRVLLLQWEQPFDIEQFFMPASSLNWSTEGVELLPGKVMSFIDKDGWASTQLLDGSLAALPDDFITVVTNLPLNGTCYGCPEVQAVYSADAACMWQRMFQPHHAILARAKAQLAELYPAGDHPYVALHLRLGGLIGEEGAPGPERGKSPLHNFVAAARCAAQAAQHHGIDVTAVPVLAITDNHYLRKFLQERSGVMNCVTPDGLPVHLDRAVGQSLSAHQSTVVDMVLLGWSSCLVVSRSGFSEHAWLFGGGKPCRVELTSCL